jgi:hypothetical protein
VKPKELSEPSLQGIPPNRLSHFLADNDTQTRPTLSVGAQEYQKMPGGIPFPPSRGRQEFPSNEESVLFGKGLVRALASLCLQRVAHRVIRAFSGQASCRRSRRRASCGPSPSDGSRPFFHLESSYEPEIRGFSFFESCWADRYVSWLLLVTFPWRANRIFTRVCGSFPFFGHTVLFVVLRDSADGQAGSNPQIGTSSNRLLFPTGEHNSAALSTV